MKWLFVDPLNTGHRYVYNATVMRGVRKTAQAGSLEYYTRLDAARAEELERDGITVHQVPEESWERRLPSIVASFIFLARALRYARKHGFTQVHLLYLDKLLLPLFLLSFLARGLVVSGTLHWYPGRSSKERLLQRLLSPYGVLRRMVVHGSYTKQRVDRLMGRECGRVVSITYPNLHPLQESKAGEQLELPGDGPVLLAFGGLRYDKGVDLLLEAVGKLKDLPFRLVVAGKEETFSEAYVMQRAMELGLGDKVIAHIGYIPDERLPAYFERADIVVLPYRRLFLGQSGPLTEGAARGKVIVGPNHGEIGHTIKQYGLGQVFEAENVGDLSRRLADVIGNLDFFRQQVARSDYRLALHPTRFQTRYSEMLVLQGKRLQTGEG